MNVVNRIIVLLLLLVFLALALLLAILPFEALRAGQTGLGAAITWLDALRSGTPWLFAVMRIGLALLGLLIFVLLFWSEVKPNRPRAVRVHTEAGSNAMVTTDSVARRF